MAKKKAAASGRTHQFKYAEPSTAPTAAPVAASKSSIPSMAVPKRTSTVVVTTRDFSYVGQDMRRILVMGGGLLVAELVLSYVYTHTGLGIMLTNLVQL